MTHLLDTHTLIWFLENNPQLPDRTRILIEETPIIFISIVSLWEIAIKANIGKLSLSFPFNTIATNLTTLGITQLPITFQDLEIYLTLPLHHRDPFDRLLVAQSMNHSLTFISRDTEFKPYLIQQIWD